MAKTVRIQSTITITVTCGLQHQDVTNADAHVPDRLKVSPSWPKKSVTIKSGVGFYPAEIADWKTVKALANDGVITIGEIVESETSEPVKTQMSRSLKKAKSLDESLSEVTNEQL